MKDDSVDWRTGLRAGVVLAVAQCLVETLVIAALYAPFVLAPVRFFATQRYDAFVKIYLWIESTVGAPVLLDKFIGQGFTAKLVIGAPLLAMVLPVAVVLGTLTGAVLRLLVRSSRRPFALVVACLVGFELVLHAIAWLTTVHLPVEPTFEEIARNYARNFLFDGTVVAVATTAIAGGLSLLASRLSTGAQWSAATAIGAVLASSIWLLPHTASAERQAQPKPTGGEAVAESYNVVLVSIDSLRADHIGAYGYQRETSPAIDALAHEGVLFRHVSSTTAWTLPAHMSMLTGRSLLGHGVVSDDRSLTDDVPTLAEQFRAAGYTTGGIVSAPYLEKRYGFARGFDEYDDETIRFETHGDSYSSVTAPRLQKAAAAWLERHENEKFFLFLHYWDVHYDYAPGPPYDTMFDPDYTGDITGRNFYFNPAINRDMPARDLEHVVALYDGEIRLVDDHIGMLRRTLESLGLAEHTVILVTADHGDEFFEHGRKGHHRSLYDEIVRVPMVLYVPGVAPARRVVQTEASIIDVVPTLLGITGIDVPAGVEGWDLSGLAFGREEERTRRTFGELYRKDSLNVQVSVRMKDEKVIHHFNRRRAEVYDTGADPGEHRRLPLQQGFAPEQFADLTAWLNTEWPIFANRLRARGIEGVEMDEKTRDRLRALGYVE